MHLDPEGLKGFGERTNSQGAAAAPDRSWEGTRTNQ